MISVAEYHERTKHRLQAYARGPETLDWDDQPDPFRRFDGCDVVALPVPGRDSSLTWADVVNRTATAPESLTLANVGWLLELAFGLSAWKEFGPDRWSLRCNPSSGNLHPSEVYVVGSLGSELSAGVYHYVSYDHHLEQRCLFEDKESVDDFLFLALSSVHWREAWKYGERAFRYCQLDAGHALASLAYAAALLGWQMEVVPNRTDKELSTLLGLNGEGQFVPREGETPEWLCRLQPRETALQPLAVEHLLQWAEHGSWRGRARSLKAFHMYHWRVIDEVALAGQKNGASAFVDAVPRVSKNVVSSTCRVPATQLIRQRRSAQNFSRGAPQMEQQSFFRTLQALLAFDEPALAAWPWPVATHLCVFVHKVEGMTPGLYCLPRSSDGLALLQQSFDEDFMWEPQLGCEQLYLLKPGDYRLLAKAISCHQPIASDSAFSLGMLVEFRNLVETDAWVYRRLFWECGLLGQVLYLEAEAEGLRGTGIGCFFDDEMHGLLGIKNQSLQSFYHFTVGVPLQDSRIQTLPAYQHLETTS